MTNTSITEVAAKEPDRLSGDRIKQLVACRFGASARGYDRFTPVQRQLGQHLLEGVAQRLGGRDVQHILELGCGAGTLTRSLRESYPDAKLTAVDLSSDMIVEARANVSGVTWNCADAESYEPDPGPSYDLIVSSAAAQWFRDPIATLRRYRSWLSPGGLLAVAAFGARTFEELQTSFDEAYSQLARPAQRHVLPLLPFAIWQTVFRSAECSERVYTVTYSDVRTFLKAVKRAGASYPARDGWLARDVLHRMAVYYQENYPAADEPGIRVTYHGMVLYVGPSNEGV